MWLHTSFPFLTFEVFLIQLLTTVSNVCLKHMWIFNLFGTQWCCQSFVQKVSHFWFNNFIYTKSIVVFLDMVLIIWYNLNLKYFAVMWIICLSLCLHSCIWQMLFSKEAQDSFDIKVPSYVITVLSVRRRLYFIPSMYYKNNILQQPQHSPPLKSHVKLLSAQQTSSFTDHLAALTSDSSTAGSFPQSALLNGHGKNQG